MPLHQPHHTPQEQSYLPQHVVPVCTPMSYASARSLPPPPPLHTAASHEQSYVDLHDFSWEFIENAKPCQICMESMIEPNLLQCCGNAYLCHSCVENCRKRAMPCPLCKQQAFKTQVDRNYQSVIQKSRVWCPCRINGYTWSGTFQDAKLHLHECSFHIVNCPNKCIDVKLQQRFMEEHLNECPLQSVPCPYEAAGCRELPSRKDIPRHVAFNIHQHLLQIAEKNYSVSQGCNSLNST